MTNPATSLPPGFRFHPTDEELILHYLRKQAACSPCPVPIIAEVDIYKFDPWDLPAKATFGEREWYFFSPRDRKYPNGIRPNRAAASGYWKATGTDKPIYASSGNENIGVKKALVFYRGRPPKGLKTNWIMHEYRLAEAHTNNNSYRPFKLRDSSMRLDDWVLCRIYEKSNHSSTVPPLMDQEQDDSGSEDVYFSNMPNGMQPQNTLNLHKSSSLSEFLNLLFDNPSEVLGTEPGPLIDYSSLSQPLVSNSNNNGRNCSSHQLSQTESPASLAENSLKRQRPVEGCSSEGGAQSSKRHNSTCILPSFTNQFDSSQYGLLNQPLFNLQIPLNSHLGLH